MSPGEANSIANDLMEMFDLPDDLSTIITGERGELNAVAHEMLSRMTEAGQIKVGLAKLAFSVDRLRETVTVQNSRVSKQEARCQAIQEGESAHGCAHLDSLAAHVGNWIVAQKITTGILAVVGVAGLGFVVWAIQEIVSRR